MHATILRLSNQPEEALALAEQDYQEAKIDLRIQEYLEKFTPGGSVKKFADFIMATNIGLFMHLSILTISHLSLQPKQLHREGVMISLTAFYADYHWDCLVHFSYSYHCCCIIRSMFYQPDAISFLYDTIDPHTPPSSINSSRNTVHLHIVSELDCQVLTGTGCSAWAKVVDSMKARLSVVLLNGSEQLKWDRRWEEKEPSSICEK